MKTKVWVLIIGMLSMISCDEEHQEVKKLDFNLSGAKAILYADNGDGGGRIANLESQIFKIDAEGNLSSIVEGVTVVSVKTFSDGLFVVTSDQRKFYVRLDNTFEEITDEIGGYRGENLAGDLIFSNAKVFRRSTKQIESFQTTLNNPVIQSVSGNFAILTDNSIYQIINTVTGIRYNVAGCNGPKMIALDQTTALIDDCQNEILISMEDGARTSGDISMWNHEGITTTSGVVLLSQGLDGGSTGYQLGLINKVGTLSLLSDYGFAPGSSSCMNCGFSNEVLFNSGDYFIVRELSKVTLIRKGDPTPEFILTDYNVTSISLDGTLVYYLAEDNKGVPLTGVYDLSTGVNQILDSGQQFDVIQTFNPAG